MHRHHRSRVQKRSMSIEHSPKCKNPVFQGTPLKGHPSIFWKTPLYLLDQ